MCARCSAASTLDCPPDRNSTPGSTTPSSRNTPRARSVRAATSSGAALTPLPEPGRTMLGFINISSGFRSGCWAMERAM
eukprot:CAMPEP_0202918176 /NCGR_PEP_ID=MMETSP1392-20130828/72826_1 /ASSEMBLY_ACC=CAM_ASM_000868 /TAXON_ID=225041 /ORGANISM="Chlamydomonas chlamydogama, Strain SAG 11-48b" /LENGTH=78 /DNA_ID=CAMNT_0049611155 /DNA_START=49 /DNA_END=285 /DNA_ORIENTATION=+